MWTGTSATGAFQGPNCGDWLSLDVADEGLRGSVGSTVPGNWTAFTTSGNLTCNFSARLYCIEK